MECNCFLLPFLLGYQKRFCSELGGGGGGGIYLPFLPPVSVLVIFYLDMQR